jgi:hypothetical protein
MDHPTVSLVLLPTPYPPGLAATFGYAAAARYVAFLWEPAGDEVVFLDGCRLGTGHGRAFQAFRRHPAVRPVLDPYNLGASDVEAEHCLILDRTGERLLVAPLAEARVLLAAQRTALLTDRNEDRGPKAEPVGDLLNVNRWQEVALDPEAVREAMRKQDEATARMLRFLDTHA